MTGPRTLDVRPGSNAPIGAPRPNGRSRAIAVFGSAKLDAGKGSNSALCAIRIKLFPSDRRCGLVLSHPLKRGVANVAILRPLCETDFCDEDRLHP